MIELKLNGQTAVTSASPDTPLLYVLSDDLALRGPKFGCGLAQCGACSVLLDGREIRSCVTPVGSIGGGEITTLEGLPALYAAQKNVHPGPAPHPLQQAFIDVQATQCGYCASGIIIKGAELLARTPHPTDQEIRVAMNGHLCRCGTYPRIMSAIKRASLTMRKAGP